MGRKLYYYTADIPSNQITDGEWEEIFRLQKWYNSEFMWTCGRLAFKMYAVFPNWEYLSIDSTSYWSAVKRRARELRQILPSENEVVRALEKEKLVIVKKGGYREDSLASGFTKVAGNEFNAYLVCDFILKISMIARNCDFTLRDEGRFIKCREVVIREGKVRVRVGDKAIHDRVRELIENRRVFSVVDSTKYDDYPTFRTTVAGFGEMDQTERRAILKDWNWLGFTSTYDLEGDDLTGYDLNQKVISFEILEN